MVRSTEVRKRMILFYSKSTKTCFPRRRNACKSSETRKELSLRNTSSCEMVFLQSTRLSMTKHVRSSGIIAIKKKKGRKVIIKMTT